MAISIAASRKRSTRPSLMRCRAHFRRAKRRSKACIAGRIVGGKPGVRIQESESGDRSQESGVRNQKSGVRSQKSGRKPNFDRFVIPAQAGIEGQMSLLETLFSTVIPSPSHVILSEAKNPCSSLRVSSARNLALSIFKAVRDSSSPAAPRNDSRDEFLHAH